jgi:uncharacterized protein (TIGR03067 family)
VTPTTLFAALALSLAAPKLKDPPATAPSLVGKWELVEWLDSGAKSGVFGNTVHEYTADGKRIIHTGEDAESGRTFQIVPKSDPPAIDLFRKLGDGPPDHFRAIYKVEKDVYTLCIGKQDGDRPTRFESTAETGWQLMTFKRKAEKE